MAEPLAALPMYDWPEVRRQADALWGALARALNAGGFKAPGDLTRSDDPESVWLNPDLLLSQTCGYPFITRLKGRVQIIGTPHYAVEGCDGPNYSSAIICRSDDVTGSLQGFRGCRAAVNNPDSQSGMSALRHSVAPYSKSGRFFGDVILSGGHRQSIRAVAEGQADVAAIDAVCWHLAQTHEAETCASLRVVQWSASAPGLPLITSLKTSERDRVAIGEIIQSVFSDPKTAEERAPLALTGLSVLGEHDYQRIAEMEAEAAALGYPALA